MKSQLRLNFPRISDRFGEKINKEENKLKSKSSLKGSDSNGDLGVRVIFFTYSLQEKGLKKQQLKPPKKNAQISWKILQLEIKGKLKDSLLLVAYKVELHL
ncbi:CLUMA_CG013586, isoform A [Clunio marinus]|uniref:CLUMA_CG013586, isoform A n=1 Tax=Clunio marinus TaxID=568069 RepID=A0A1J1IP92_9DIPT|nr:CLUMA_CG013586, isoform A [Clunio marinus]